MSILNTRYDQYMRLFRELKAGRRTIEETEALRKLLTDSGKDIDRWIKVYVSSATIKGFKKDAAKSNLVGDHAVMGGNLVDTEHEKVKCPGLDFKLIERHQCLDYSGEKKFPECEGCETGLITKRLLLSNAIEHKPGPQAPEI